MGGISIWQIIIILLVIIILFGMGKLPKIAEELGKALKLFRSSVATDDEIKPTKTKTKTKLAKATTKTKPKAKPNTRSKKK